jgi:hypothetical protein
MNNENKFKFFQILLVVLGLVILLPGCQPDYRIKHPDIISIGTFEGCVVTLIDRGDDRKNFYIARCQAMSTTTTSTFSQSEGKSSHSQERIVVSTEQLCAR